MVRSIAGIAAGLVAWIAVATAANVLVRMALPGYADVESAMNFTPAMLWARLLEGALASLAAGAAVAWISPRSRRNVVILSGLLLALFIPVHYSLWARFPAWYHAVFLLSLPIGSLAGALGMSRLRGTPAVRQA